jgi:hypothetical protein
MFAEVGSSHKPASDTNPTKHVHILKFSVHLNQNTCGRRVDLCQNGGFMVRTVDLWSDRRICDRWVCGESDEFVVREVEFASKLRVKVIDLIDDSNCCCLAKSYLHNYADILMLQSNLYPNHPSSAQYKQNTSGTILGHRKQYFGTIFWDYTVQETIFWDYILVLQKTIFGHRKQYFGTLGNYFRP